MTYSCEHGPDIAELVRRVQEHVSPLETVYQSHERWPLPPRGSEGSAAAQTPGLLRIAVLDSSFNPPTRAHLALALSDPPSVIHSPPYPSFGQAHEPAAACASDPLTLSGVPGDVSATTHTYTARLLLLSVRNADKALRPGDATHAQRVEMMCRLVRDMESHLARRRSSPAVVEHCAMNVLEQRQARERDQGPELHDADAPVHADANVAVALLNEPTFVRKAQVLHAFLERRLAKLQPPSTTSRVELTFLVGFDTLERLFAPRYYAATPKPVPGATAPSATGSSAVEDAGEATAAMHAALRAFFGLSESGNQADVGGGSAGGNGASAYAHESADADVPLLHSVARVVCAYRDPSSWLTPSANAAIGDTVAAEAALRARATMALAQPYIDAGCIAFVDLNAEVAALSSSAVRARVRGAREWREMVPPEVAEYVAEEGLYMT